MLDDIIAGITEVLLDMFSKGISDFIFQSKAPKWIRTIVYLLLTQPVTVLLACIGLFNKNITQTGRYVSFGMAVVWCIATVIYAIYKRKRKWKKT